MSDDEDKRLVELTREALADVDSGKVVDHHLVEAWAKSLETDSPSPLPKPAS